MDIYSLLEKDHRKVDDLFETLTNARSDATRIETLQQIHDELALHAKTEEATFYAALEDVSETHLKDLMPEHDELRGYFAKLKACKVSSPRWFILVGELKHAVSHHVEEEEGMIFKYARSVLNHRQANELGRQMELLKASEEPTDTRIHEAPAKAA